MTKIFKLANIGTLIFFCLNLSLLLTIFTSGFSNTEAIPSVIVFYIITVAISLSPVGEWIIGVLAGARELRRYDLKLKLVPLLDIVVERATAQGTKLPSKIKLKIIHDQSPNAYAMGRKTICVTDGLLEADDNMIMGIFAHEVGHLAYKHTALQVLIGGGNVLIAGFILILKLFAWIFTAICSLIAFRNRRSCFGCLLGIVAVIPSIMMFLWTKFCMLFLRISMRQNEYVADKFAFDIGFGNELAAALDAMHAGGVPKNGLLQALYATHPDYHDRIARLQMMGATYSRF